MLGRKKPSKQDNAIEVTKLSSLIATNVQIIGDVIFTGGLRVDGSIEGNVLHEEGSNGLLVLSDQGLIKGRVITYDAVVNGTIEGDLVVHHFLELHARAKVRGNISYRQLQMECGAGLEGQLMRLEDEEVAPTIDENVIDMPQLPQAAGTATG